MKGKPENRKAGKPEVENQTEIAEGDRALGAEEAQELLKDPNVRRFLQLAGQASVKPKPKMSSIEIKMQEIRDEYSPEDRDRAMSWFLHAFDRMIKVSKKGKAHLYFAEITSTQRTRDMGYTSLAEGWTVTIGGNVETLVLMYIDVILDDAYKTDEERIFAMIEYSKENPKGMGDRGMHDNEWSFLVSDVGKLEIWTHKIE